MEERRTEMEDSVAEAQETTKPREDGFQEFQLHKLLIDLNSNSKTGTLSVKMPVFLKKIYLDKGQVVFASSTCKDDRLGEALLKAGRITLGQYEESSTLVKVKGKKQGTILVELGYLTPKDLFDSVKYQVKEIIYSLFPLEYVEHEFIEEEVTQKDISILRIHLGSLIYKGIKRIDNFTRIKKELPDSRYSLSISIGRSNLFEDIVFSPLEKSILSLVDGRRSIVELVDHASTDARPFEILRSLYVLWVMGILQKNSSTGKETETQITETHKTETGNNGKMWDLENIIMFSPDNNG